MIPNKGFPEYAFDSAISSLDLETLSDLIREAVANGYSREIAVYLQKATDQSGNNPLLQIALLTTLKMQALKGLDFDMHGLFSRLQGIEPHDFLDVARRIIMSEFKTHVRNGNTFFLSVERLYTSEAAVSIKDIIDARRSELELLCSRNPTMEELAATYYGFQFLTAGIRENEAIEGLDRLFECLGLHVIYNVPFASNTLDPNKVVFRNVSASLDELLRNILLLTSYNSERRAKATTRLGELRDPRAEPYLAKATKDQYSWVRKPAVLALGQIRLLEDPKCVVDALKDADEGTRNTALDSVVSIGSNTVPYLLDILEMYRGLSYSDSLEAVKKTHPRALDNLDAMLQYHSRTARVLAAKALGKIRDPRSIPALERALLDTEPEVSSAAECALAEIREK